MTDKELLELAAKAAGYSVKFDDNVCVRRCIGGCHCPEQYYPRNFGHDGNYGEVVGGWNALTDDGDAFRLAVKLGMEVHHADDGGMAACAQYPNARGYAYAVEPYGDCAIAATRRAIVRAAAEIGKAMQ